MNKTYDKTHDEAYDEAYDETLDALRQGAGQTESPMKQVADKVSRVYICMPAIYYYKKQADNAIELAHDKWPEADVILPDATNEIYLKSLKDVDTVVYVPLDDGRITYGVGNEIVVAFNRKIPLYGISKGKFLNRVYKIPKYLSREDTREVEIAFIEQSRPKYR